MCVCVGGVILATGHSVKSKHVTEPLPSHPVGSSANAAVTHLVVFASTPNS